MSTSTLQTTNEVDAALRGMKQLLLLSILFLVTVAQAKEPTPIRQHNLLNVIDLDSETLITGEVQWEAAYHSTMKDEQAAIKAAIEAKGIEYEKDHWAAYSSLTQTGYDTSEPETLIELGRKHRDARIFFIDIEPAYYWQSLHEEMVFYARLGAGKGTKVTLWNTKITRPSWNENRAFTNAQARHWVNENLNGYAAKLAKILPCCILPVYAKADQTFEEWREFYKWQIGMAQYLYRSKEIFPTVNIHDFNDKEWGTYLPADLLTAIREELQAMGFKDMIWWGYAPQAKRANADNLPEGIQVLLGHNSGLTGVEESQ